MSAPFHHANQTFTPIARRATWSTAAICALQSRRTSACTQCHADLHTIGAPTQFTAEITRFNGGHPEFAILRNRGSDPGTIKLNHSVHLKHNLRGTPWSCAARLRRLPSHRAAASRMEVRIIAAARYAR